VASAYTLTIACVTEFLYVEILLMHFP
jgi:hypothetical protein